MYKLKNSNHRTLHTGTLEDMRKLMKKTDPKCDKGHYIQYPKQ